MAESQSFALSLLSSAGVSALLSGAIIWLARNWISARLSASIKHEYDQKLAALNAELKSQGDVHATMLKASIERESDKLRFATSSFGEAQKAAVERKLSAVETLWQGVLAARENVPPIMGFIDILTVEEYTDPRNQSTFSELTGDLSQEKIMKLYKDSYGSLERVRPYVGEYLWALFAIYQALILRVVFLIHLGKDDAKKLNWHQDPGIDQLLTSSFDVSELKEFASVKVGKISWLQRKYELKILTAMEKIISGEEFGKEALLQAQQMEKQAQALNQQFSLTTNPLA